jgi:hypothetical protein
MTSNNYSQTNNDSNSSPKQNLPVNRLNFPLPTGLTSNDRAYGYWLGLQEILNKGYFNSVLSPSKVKEIYRGFGKLEVGLMRGYIKKLNDEIDQLIFQRELILGQVTQNETRKTISDFLKYFPARFHEAIYNFVAEDIEISPQVMEEIDYALKNPQAEYVYGDQQSYLYENYDPDLLMEELRDKNFTLEDLDAKPLIQNTKPVPQSQLEELLNSTTEIRENLEELPSGQGVNPLIHQREIAKSNLNKTVPNNRLNTDSMRGTFGQISQQIQTNNGFIKLPSISAAKPKITAKQRIADLYKQNLQSKQNTKK